MPEFFCGVCEGAFLERIVPIWLLENSKGRISRRSAQIQLDLQFGLASAETRKGRVNRM